MASGLDDVVNGFLENWTRRFMAREEKYERKGEEEAGESGLPSGAIMTELY